MEYVPAEAHGHDVSSDPYFAIVADDDGVGFVRCGDGVLVVPLSDEGEVLLAMEHSPAFRGPHLGLVAGALRAGERLEQAANRELQEELGWRAGRVDYLGELHVWKYLTTRQFVFLARDLVPSRLPGDERYPVLERRVPLEGFLALCTSGELHDALAVAALCLTREFLSKEVP